MDGLGPRRFGRLLVTPSWVEEDPEPGLATVVLDPEMAFRLLELGFHPLGTLVELAGGEWAEVIATHRIAGDATLASLPIVRLRRLANGTFCSGFVAWNLAQCPAARIARALTSEEAAILPTA